MIAPIGLLAGIALSQVMAEPQLMPGWPDTVFSNPGWGWGHGEPILGDVDGNGDFEVLCGSFDGKVHIWKYDGTYLLGWPQATGAPILGSPALGDVDGDGDMEVVVCSRKPPYFEGPATIWIWHHTGKLLDGWPKTLRHNPTIYTPSLFDLDSDGTLEIIVVGNHWRGVNSKVHIFHYNGKIFPGWPQPMDSSLTISASVGDLDNDGDFEIVSIGYRMIFAWHSDGTLLPNWPIELPKCGADTKWIFRSYESPALADFDQDGDLEIVVGSRRMIPRVTPFMDAWLHVYEHDGKHLQGWPLLIESIPDPSAAVGDIDQDGDPEIVICDAWDSLHVFHHDGTELDGFPVYKKSVFGACISIADIDGDRDIELIVPSNMVSNGGFLYAFHHDGTLVEGWPLRPPGFTCYKFPTIADVDRDGSTNLAFLSQNGPWAVRPNDAYIWLYDLKANYDPEKVEWGCYSHDVWHTGCYGFQVPLGIEEKYEPQATDYKLRIYPNPFPFSTTIEYTLPCESEVNIEIYDISGRMTRLLIDGMMESGYHRLNLISKNLPNGIYFVRFKISDYEETKKLILIQ